MKKKTTEEFITKAKEIHKDKYDYSKVEYTNKRSKVTIICPIHGEFEQVAHAHLSGKGCPKCAIETRRKKTSLTAEEFIERAKQIHDNKYDYSKTVYNGSNKKLVIICPVHGEFEQTARAHLEGKGCKLCSYEKRKKINPPSVLKPKKAKLLNTSDFITEAKKVHGDKYDYSKVEYVKKKQKVLIICPIHGEFWQTPEAHLNGQGCAKCGVLKASGSRKASVEDFIIKARKIHGDFYDYSKVNYINALTKVCIICPEHGEFWQTPAHHTSGHRCPQCGNIVKGQKRRNTLDEFIQYANNIHGNKYDYSKADYDGNKKKVCIICPKHGEFHQTPNDHLLGKGCPSCGHITSKVEDEILEVIKSTNPIHGDRSVLNGKEIDIYIPSLKVGIEYNGLRWHSEFFAGKDRHYHIDKLNCCNNKGIRLIQIFEDEYVNHKDIVLSKIKHILHIDNDKQKIYARKCNVVNIHKFEAKEFLNKNHIQGFAGATVYLGLKYNDKLVGVMSFVNCGNGLWDLNRFATDIEYNCIGFGGKLFQYFVRNYDFTEIKSFADRRWTTDVSDNLYTKLGFEFDSVLKPEYRYYNPSVDRFNRFHKFGFRKQSLHKKYGLPLTMTETEMIKELGYDRIWDCGLIKYVYRKH